MSNTTETVNIVGGFSTNSWNSHKILHLVRLDVSKKQLSSRLLPFVEAIVEYSFGMYMGAAIGFLLGWYAGSVYVEHFEPVYFSDLSEIRQWSRIPYEFAGNGKLVGAAAGAIMIMLINSLLLAQKIVSLYEKEVTDPKDIARALGMNVRKIQKRISKLAKKKMLPEN